MTDAKQRREHVRQSLKWIRLRIARAKSQGQEGEAKLWQKALAILARQDKALVRVRAENKRLRDERGDPIPIGTGDVAIALGYAQDDPRRVEREVIIYKPDTRRPVDESLEDAGKSSDDLDVLVRLRIDDADGAWVLMDTLYQAITSARGGPQKLMPSEVMQMPVEARRALMERDVKIEQLRKALRFFLDIVNQSSGIDGFHLNEDVALWGEFKEEIDDACEVVE